MNIFRELKRPKERKHLIMKPPCEIFYFPEMLTKIVFYLISGKTYERCNNFRRRLPSSLPCFTIMKEDRKKARMTGKKEFQETDDDEKREDDNEKGG